MINPGVQKPPCLGIKRAQPQGVNRKFIYVPWYTYQVNTVLHLRKNILKEHCNLEHTNTVLT